MATNSDRTATNSGMKAVLCALIVAISACSSDGSSAAANGSRVELEPQSSVVDEEGSPLPIDCAMPEIMCAGLVVGPGLIERHRIEPIVDAHLSDMHIVDVVSAADNAEFELRVGAMIDKSLDLIIVSGVGGPAIVALAAQQEPDLAFIAIGALDGSGFGKSESDSEELDNLLFVEFDLERAAFVAGAVAGLLTDSNKIGAVMASEADPALVRIGLGWERGVRFVNPEAEFLTFFNPSAGTESFDDPSWAAEATRAQLIQGADVVLGAGGATGNAALVEAARSQGATLCVGVVDDQYQSTKQARPCLVASIVLELEPVLGKALDTYLASGGSNGWVEGETTLALAPGNPLPDEIASKLDEIQAGLADGSIDPRAD